VCKSDAMSLRPAPRADVQLRSRLEHILAVGIASGTTAVSTDGKPRTSTDEEQELDLKATFDDGKSFKVKHVTGYMNDRRLFGTRTDYIRVEGIRDPHLALVISAFKQKLEAWGFAGVRPHDTLKNTLWFTNDAAQKEKQTANGDVINELDVAKLLAHSINSTSMVGDTISKYEYIVREHKTDILELRELELYNRRPVWTYKTRLAYTVEASGPRRTVHAE